MLRRVSLTLCMLVLSITTACGENPTAPADAEVSLSPRASWSCTHTVTSTGTYYWPCEWYDQPCEEDPSQPQCDDYFPEDPEAPTPGDDGSCNPGMPCGGSEGGGSTCTVDCGGGGEPQPTIQQLITHCDPPGSSTCILTPVQGALRDSIMATALRMMNSNTGEYCFRSGYALYNAAQQFAIYKSSTWFMVDDTTESLGRTQYAAQQVVLSGKRKSGYTPTDAEFVQIARHEAGHLGNYLHTQIYAQAPNCSR